MDYIKEIGKPESILTDNGRQFSNKKWREKMKELGITVTFSTIYHSQSNPANGTTEKSGGYYGHNATINTRNGRTC